MPILNWLTREEDIKAAQAVPYRVLKEVPNLGYGDRNSGNILIQGDNLEALKALLPFYAGRVKCIYIDPPFNTGAAFDHYDDNLEHTKWLKLMWPRLVLLQEFLKKEGIIFIHIDNKEGAYAKVILDEIFGRKNFLNTLVVKTSDPSGHKVVNPSPYDQTEFVLMYARDRRAYSYIPRYIKSEYDPLYNKIILNPTAPHNDWQVGSFFQFVSEEIGFSSSREAKKHLSEEGFFARCAEIALREKERVYQPTAISNAAGKNIVKARDWTKKNQGKTVVIERDEYDDVFIRDGRQMYFYSSKVHFIDNEETPAKLLTNLWTDIPWNGIANEGNVQFKNGKKPEKLIQRCIDIASGPGDLVMDSFLGSGTAAAVAHKMGRSYIGIEIGEHAVTHCAPRLRAVIDGEQSGISQSVGWQGGGGFRFYRLGSPVFDEAGEICRDIEFPVLAAHVWFSETNLPWDGKGKSPLLGIHNGRALALLYNGILRDKSIGGGNVLTRVTLRAIRDAIAKIDKNFDGPLTVYGERTALGVESLAREGIEFKQTPYDVKARR